MSTIIMMNWQPKFRPKSPEHLWEMMLQERAGGKELEAFLHPGFQHLCDPQKMWGMDKAVQRILKAIEDRKRIMIFGDFDTDGITSTVMLFDGLKRLGAQVSYRIPDRVKDSHGLKTYHIDEIAQTQTNLILTCDCGINDYQEVEYATQKGMEVIITDHHISDPKKFPKTAVAILNPNQEKCNYPEKNLSGAGVALKLLQGLTKALGLEEAEAFLAPYLELAALGQTADCMPQSGEVRTLNILGLQHLQNSHWSGLKHLLKLHNVSSVDEETIGFTIAPCLNAASRIGEVGKALQLFIGPPEHQFDQAQYLQELNLYRRELTTQSIKTAQAQVNSEDLVHVFFHETWSVGLLGLIAGHFSTQTKKPCIALTLNDAKVHGSARSPKSAHITEILTDHSQFLEHFGGHAQAAGLQMDPKNLDTFKKALKGYTVVPKDTEPEDMLEAFIPHKWLNKSWLESQKKLAPFGAENPHPVFGLQNMKLISWGYMGQDQNHIRATFTHQGDHVNMVAFFAEEIVAKLKEGTVYTLLVQAKENTWNGETSVQLQLVTLLKED